MSLNTAYVSMDTSRSANSSPNPGVINEHYKRVSQTEGLLGSRCESRKSHLHSSWILGRKEAGLPMGAFISEED